MVNKLSHVFELLEVEMPVEQAFKSIDFRDIAVFTSLSGEKVSKETIKNCFGHVGWDTKEKEIETDILIESFKEEFAAFIKDNKIVNAIGFEKYAEEDFNYSNILEEDVEEDDEEAEDFTETENLDQNITEPEIEKIHYPSVEKALSIIYKYIYRDNIFNLDARCKLLDLKGV